MRTAPAEPADVIVIGAGPAGLAVAATLRRAGLAPLVVDRAATVGSSWRHHYDRLRLHTVARHSALPFSPWPSGTPRYPSRADVIAYLERYAVEHQIAPRFGVEVRRLTRASRRFSIETSDGRLDASAVVVATGANAVPHVPDLPGLARFGGPVAHSASYRNPAPYAGLRTLVVGCGNSGAEIALDLAEHGVEVAMVVRGPVHVVPRDLWRRSSQETAILLSRLPLAVRDLVAGAVLRLAVGDLSRWGLVRPDAGPNRLIEERGRVPLLDVGTVSAIVSGRIRVVPAIEEVGPGAVRFTGGRTEPFEAMVLATGYRPGLERFIDGMETVADRHGRPAGVIGTIPGLFFVGFRTRATGALREIGIEAGRVAAAIGGPRRSDG